MNYLYIIDPKNYQGFIQNSMPEVAKEEINNTIVHYSEKTFEEYNKEHGGNLIALTWDEFNGQFHAPYILSLQTKFKEITEEQYYDGLECLPPKKWHDLNSRFNMFFIGECTTDTLYGCYIKDRQENKYYCALRSIYVKDEEIINQLNNL